MKKNLTILFIVLFTVICQNLKGQTLLDSLNSQEAIMTSLNLQKGNLDSIIEVNNQHSMDISTLELKYIKIRNSIDSVGLLQKKNGEIIKGLVRKFDDHENINFEKIILLFKNLTLPITYDSKQIENGRIDGFVGKFAISENYTGFILGTVQGSLDLEIYDDKGIFIDGHYLSMHSASYNFQSDVTFEITKDLIINLKCEGDKQDCEGYPEKYKIINGKIVKQN